MAAQVFDVFIDGDIAAEAVPRETARLVSETALATGADITSIKAAGHAPETVSSSGDMTGAWGSTATIGYEFDPEEFEAAMSFDELSIFDTGDEDEDVLELGSSLTKEGDFFEVAGLSLADSLPENVATQTYQASTLADWANALSDVESTVHVGLAPTLHHTTGDTDLALYAQIGDSDVIAFAAPLLPDEDGEDEEGDA